MSNNSLKRVRQSTCDKELLNLQPVCKCPGNGYAGLNAGLIHLHTNTLIRSIFSPESFSSGLGAVMASVEKVGVMTLCCKVDYFSHIINFNSSWSWLQLFDAVEHQALLKPLYWTVYLKGTLLMQLSLPISSAILCFKYKTVVSQNVFCVNQGVFWCFALSIDIYRQGGSYAHLALCLIYFNTLIPFLSYLVWIQC